MHHLHPPPPASFSLQPLPIETLLYLAKLIWRLTAADPTWCCIAVKLAICQGQVAI